MSDFFIGLKDDTFNRTIRAFYKKNYRQSDTIFTYHKETPKLDVAGFTVDVKESPVLDLSPPPEIKKAIRQLAAEHLDIEDTVAEHINYEAHFLVTLPAVELSLELMKEKIVRLPLAVYYLATVTTPNKNDIHISQKIDLKYIPHPEYKSIVTAAL